MGGVPGARHAPGRSGPGADDGARAGGTGGPPFGGAPPALAHAHAHGVLYRLLGEDQAAADHYALAEHVALAGNSPHRVTEARRAGARLAPERKRRTLANRWSAATFTAR
ncbi:hypothetical protein ACFWBB_01845 [Streptomyces sp. NPDC060000]|uniref:hypothetical protein n=1 Tax=Streptomyces sp. NPDC060000 TaxID=3347031 RepID=UPI00368B5710